MDKEDVMKYSVEAFAERMLLEGDLQGNRIVLQLLNQRTELLEALKLADLKIVKMYDGITCGCGEDYAKIDEDSIAIREAITKAEASE